MVCNIGVVNSESLLSHVPPVAAVYQPSRPIPVALSVTDFPWQMSVSRPVGGGGMALADPANLSIAVSLNALQSGPALGWLVHALTIHSGPETNSKLPTLTSTFLRLVNVPVHSMTGCMAPLMLQWIRTLLSVNMPWFWRTTLTSCFPVAGAVPGDVNSLMPASRSQGTNSFAPISGFTGCLNEESISWVTGSYRIPASLSRM